MTDDDEYYWPSGDTFGYDLEACLHYNPQPEITVRTIAEVLAVWEGERDGDDWRWVLKMKDGRFAFLQGGCDYTGWDCQSWATSILAMSAEEAATGALGNIPSGTNLEPKGLGHMLSIITGEYMSNAKEVYDDLIRQLDEGKTKTWREVTGEKLGLTEGEQS